MQISELQLRQNIQLLLKEEVYGKIATVYHGSKQPPEEFIKLFENESGLVGWEKGKGAGSMYGHGLYTVWTKTGHQTFKGGYGNWIYKFKVNLEGFIIFDETVCKQVYGKSLTPLQQLEKLGKKQLFNKFDAKTKRVLSKRPIANRRSADLAASTASYLAGNVNGIVFWGSNDGPVVIAYDPNIVTPMSYAKLEDAKKDIWTRWNPTEIKNSLSRSAHAGTFVDPERLQSSEIAYDFNKLINISDENLMKVLERTSFTSLNWTTLENITNKDFRRKILSFASNIERFKDLAASSKDTPPEALEKLSKDGNIEIRLKVASNPSTSAKVLIKLSRDRSLGIKRKVAKNESTPPEALIKLADDKDISVRMSVASNPNSPQDLITKMANSDDPKIRQNVARNKSATKELLNVLMNDVDDGVKWWAAERNLEGSRFLESLLRRTIRDVYITL